MIGIGIDTGGTFTDAVVFDDETAQVLASCKTLTTHEDLTRCIGAALDKLPAELFSQTQRVSLSTTLATNACVEGKGGRAHLVIAGTNRSVLERVNAPATYGISYDDVLPVPFSGSFDGIEAKAPDWEAICNENDEFFREADSFGIAGLFALSNGAIAERTGSEYLAARYGKPVIMATSVAAALNVIERGATALLNARLIPVIDEFIAAIARSLENRGLEDVSIAIVRSNGTLMSSRFAQISPVETILSGPAASAVGALALAQVDEGLVIDMGGTTTDICVVHGGKPVTSEGIRIGGWRTQVRGAQIDTIGLGGDSVVRFTKTGGLELQARRVMPLCIAATRWPHIKDMMLHYLEVSQANNRSYYEIVYLSHDPEDRTRYNEKELAAIDLLREGPVSCMDVRLEILMSSLERLEDEGIVMRCGVTPTDAMHVKGDFDAFDVEAAKLGMCCLLRSYPHDDEMPEDEQIDMMADVVYGLVNRKLYGQIVRVLLQDRYPQLRDQALSDQVEVLVDDAWKRFIDNVPASPFDMDFTTSMTLVGIGAPTHVFLPTVARALGAPCVIPEHAEVANAVGAICAHVVAEETVHVIPHRVAAGIIDVYTVSSRTGTHSTKNFDEAMDVARTMARDLACMEATQRGAAGDITCELSEETINVGTGTASLVMPIEWIIKATAYLV